MRMEAKAQEKISERLIICDAFSRCDHLGVAECVTTSPLQLPPHEQVARLVGAAVVLDKD